MKSGLLRAAVLTWVGAGLALPLAGQDDNAIPSLEELLGTPVNTAAKRDQTMSEAPASVTVLTRQELLAYGYRTLGEALVNARGLYGSYDRNYFYIGTRGFSRPGDYNNRILLLVDGHRMNEEFYGSASIGTEFGLSLDVVERIEIVRGPGSALYGGAAMFAVVNVITRRGRDLAGSEITGGGGSDAFKDGRLTWGRLLDNGLDVMLSGNWFDGTGEDRYYPEFDSPDTNGGVAQRLDWDRGGGAMASVSMGSMHARFFASSREKAVPTAPWETLFNVETWTRDQRFALALGGDFELDERRSLFVRTFWDRSVYEGVYPYEDPWTQSERSQIDWFGGEARLRWDLGSAIRVITGLEAFHAPTAEYAVEDGTGVLSQGDWGFSSFSGYVQGEVQASEALLVTAGARADYIDGKDNLSPRLAVVFHASPSTTFKALYGTAFRPPNRYELFYEIPDESRSNPALDAETVRTVELVAERQLGDRLWVAGSVFDFHVDGLIDGAIDPDSELSFFTNQSSMKAIGAEVELWGRLDNATQLFMSAYRQSVELNGDPDEPVANAPEHGMRLGASRRFARPGLTLAFDGQYDGRRMSAYGDPVDAFVVGNATVTLHEILGRARLTVSVRNLFDTRYATPGGFEHLQAGIVQDGRQLRATLTVGF